MQGNTISVERVINAPAAEIFALIADAGKHSSFDGSGTVAHAVLDAADGGEASQPLELGSKFGMSMRGRPESLFLPYRTTNTVIEFEPDRRIAWKTTIGPGGLIGGRIWRYELSPTEGGTLVRETWDLSQDRQRPMLKMGAMPRQAEDGMRATLERIAAILGG
ncbi:MAG TPA: SRPBCC family protein [Mycobacterium sp.]|nr:SRPBCC family protein [Mycobacterium sp.]